MMKLESSGTALSGVFEDPPVSVTPRWTVTPFANVIAAQRMHAADDRIRRVVDVTEGLGALPLRAEDERIEEAELDRDPDPQAADEPHRPPATSTGSTEWLLGFASLV